MHCTFVALTSKIWGIFTAGKSPLNSLANEVYDDDTCWLLHKAGVNIYVTSCNLFINISSLLDAFSKTGRVSLVHPKQSRSATSTNVSIYTKFSQNWIAIFCIKKIMNLFFSSKVIGVSGMGNSLDWCSIL